MSFIYIVKPVKSSYNVSLDLGPSLHVSTQRFIDSKVHLMTTFRILIICEIPMGVLVITIIKLIVFNQK